MKEIIETSPKLPRRYVVLGVVGILVVASCVLWSWYLPDYGGGVDEASYFWGAKGIATRLDPVFLSPDPTLFVPENQARMCVDFWE
jgi:hypothetical protein